MDKLAPIVIKLIRYKWLDTQMLVHSNRAYKYKSIMNFCEDKVRVDYIIAMVNNPQLKL